MTAEAVSAVGRLIIIGASGQGRVAADIAELTGFSDIVFLDDDPSASVGGYPLSGPVSMAHELEGLLFVAIGNPAIRRKIMDSFPGRRFATLIHPKAAVSRRAEIGEGSIVMACAAVNPGAKLGRGCIVNTCGSVDHDSKVGEFVHVAVGAHVCGTVTVGDGTWLGAGAVISNNISVCGGCMIGAGAAVVRDIALPGTYTGVPARLIRRAPGELSV